MRRAVFPGFQQIPDLKVELLHGVPEFKVFSIQRLYFFGQCVMVGASAGFEGCCRVSGFMAEFFRKKVFRLFAAFMTDNHSKILLVEARDGRRVSVVTSQNLTRGNRFESTLITTSPQIFSDLLEEFRNISEYHSVPLDEILGSRIEEN